MIKFILAGLSVALLMGCGKPINPRAIESADYGPPPPPHYRQMIRDEFSKILIDPTSPLFEFNKPIRGYTKKSQIHGTGQNFGWQVCGTVNSKNKMGGYVGKVPFFVLFRNGKITEFVVGRMTTNRYGINIQNSAIIRACQRAV